MDVEVGNEVDRNRTGRWAMALLGASTLAGPLLRAWQIGGKSLWIDEAFSVWVARQPLAEGVAWLARIDQHPPLYCALLHLWLCLDDGPAAVRLLSALASTLNVPVLYRLGACLAGRKVGLLAATVLALSPFHVYLAQEARMYALLSLTVSLSLWALARLLCETRRTATLIPLCAVEIARTGRPTAQKTRLTMTVPRPAPKHALPGQQLRDAYVAWRHRGRRPRTRDVATDLAWSAYVVCTAAALWTHSTAVLYWVAANAIVLGLWVAGRGRPARAGALAAPWPCSWAPA